jgi:hypothetical protein
MIKRATETILVLATTWTLAACTEPSIYRTANFDDGTSSITDAKQRVLVNTPGNKAWGKNRPKRIVCAEPSPDVAQALSSAISSSFAGAVNGKGSVSADLAASMSAGVVQLGERLATVQLLRDGLFRACEAYSNGAISDATYSLIVSRVDQTMVALLTSEMAAGAFGRDLAAIGGASGGSTALSESAQEDIAGLEKQKIGLQGERAIAVKNEQDALDKERGLLEQRKTAQLAVPEDFEEVARIERDIELVQREGRLAKDEKKTFDGQISSLDAQIAAIQTSASSFSSTQAKAGGGGGSFVSNSNAKYVAEIQENFANQDKVGPLVAACVTALDSSSSYKGHVHRSQDERLEVDKNGNVLDTGPRSTPLSDLCYQMMKPNAKGQSTLTHLFEARAEQQVVLASTRATKEMFEVYLRTCSSERKDSAACTSLGDAFAAKLLEYQK